MKRLFILVLVLSLGNFEGNAFQWNAFMDPYYEMADDQFQAQSAYETVSFVEKFWRLAGNEGFNKSIRHVEEKLKRAGFILEKNATAQDRLIYRVEERDMSRPTWEPVAGSLSLANGTEVLNLETNFNMIASGSYSTLGQQEFEVVYFEEFSVEALKNTDIKGKLVLAPASVGQLFRVAVQNAEAAGVLAYRIPGYNQPENNRNSISFSGVPNDADKKSFGILLSNNAFETLKAYLASGNKTVKVNLETKVYESKELTLVAEVRGSKHPDERFVFSAHVQEPGANDNASGVGALGEVASATARLLKAGKVNPERTITYLFGDEIVSTRRFVQEDAERAKNIKWGMSLDMVGQNTKLTGGTFLIEKMPDPGAIWTRGKEKHTEWGGRPIGKDQLKPHYFNDLTIKVFDVIGERRDWEVNYNPFEGGSDHVPFLQGNIPGVLLWHFTDQFYHTDQDRIDKVSAETLKNVGIGAMMISLMLAENKDMLPDFVLYQVSMAATMRLQAELRLSQNALKEGSSEEVEKDVLSTWADYYMKVLETTLDIEPANESAFKSNLEETRSALITYRSMILSQLRK